MTVPSKIVSSDELRNNYRTLIKKIKIALCRLIYGISVIILKAAVL